MKPGDRFTFTTPWTIGPTGWTDEEFRARIGTEAEVVGLADPTTYDRAEVGDMFDIRFTTDGRTMTAWPEEIDPSVLR